MVREGRIYEDHEKWSADWPEKQGAYWFYGAPTKKHQPALWLVSCFGSPGNFAYYCDNFKSFAKTDGGFGLWMRIKEPDPPFDYQVKAAKRESTRK